MVVSSMFAYHTSDPPAEYNVEPLHDVHMLTEQLDAQSLQVVGHQSIMLSSLMVYDISSLKDSTSMKC